MKKYLVIGNPIEHSLSPRLHNYWIKENNINAVYDKKQLDESDIKGIINLEDVLQLHPNTKLGIVSGRSYGETLDRKINRLPRRNLIIIPAETKLPNY